VNFTGFAENKVAGMIDAIFIRETAFQNHGDFIATVSMFRRFSTGLDSMEGKFMDVFANTDWGCP
jgi:hypothetical protein